MSQNSGGNRKEKKDPMIQRPLRKYKQDLVARDAELARKLQREEEERSKQFHNDEMLAQQISNDLNRNGLSKVNSPDKSCGLSEEFTRYRGMTEVDALLARQIQQQEEQSVVLSARCQSPGQQDAELARSVQQEEDALYQQFHNDKMLARQISEVDPKEECCGRKDWEGFTSYQDNVQADALLARQVQQEGELSMVLGARSRSSGQQDVGGYGRVMNRVGPGNRITIRSGGPRRLRPVLPVMAPAAQLPDGEDDPDVLLMSLGGGLETNFINIMRDPRLLVMALSRTPQFTGNQANVDLNDYEGLLDLAERLGEVQNRGMSPGDIGNLPTHSHQGGATAAGQNTDCQVCLTAFEQGETIRTLPCLHEYHKECVDEWLQRNSTCPICRQNVKEST